MTRMKYKKNDRQIVTGVQINLQTEGIDYIKWGGPQHCSAGDWLVNNNGECYTVEQESFANTYKEVSPGRYVKSAPVWAEQAGKDGTVQTKEGVSKFQAGDYVVSNNEDGTDAYTVPKETFEAAYTLAID